MICIRRNTLIEVVNENGEVVAKAFREGHYSDWTVGTVTKDGQISPVGMVYSFVPELTGRKLVIAMLKEFVTSSEED